MNEILVEKKILEFEFVKDDIIITDAVKENSTEINIFLNSNNKKILTTKLGDNEIINKEIKTNNFDLSKTIILSLNKENIKFYLDNNIIHYQIENNDIREFDYNSEYIINYLNKQFDTIKDFNIIGINLNKKTLWLFAEIIINKKKKIISFSSNFEIIDNNLLIKDNFNLKNLINIHRYIRNIGFNKNDANKLLIEKIDFDDDNNLYILVKINEYGIIGKIDYFNSINSYGSFVQIFEYDNNPIILESDPISICILKDDKLLVICNKISNNNNKNGIIYYLFRDYKN